MVNMAAVLAVALPLYMWPAAGVWDPVYHTIASNPNTTFNIIVNPDSGPGSYPPDPAYVTGVAKLNSYRNVKTFGYVHTTYATRNITKVEADVKSYRSWSTYKAADIALHGIFVDEAPEDTAKLPYMKTLATYIHKTLPSNGGLIWTNPGVVVDKAFYQYADTVNAFEDLYTAWESAGSKAIPAALRNRSSVMVLNYTGSAKGVATEAKAMIKAGYHSGLVFGSDDYQEYSPLWGNFTASVDMDETHH